MVFSMSGEGLTGCSAHAGRYVLEGDVCYGMYAILFNSIEALRRDVAYVRV